MHNAIDSDLASSAKSRRVEDSRAGRDENFILNRATDDMGIRTNKAILSYAQRMTLRTAKHGVLHDNALTTNGNGTTLCNDLGAEENPTARPNSHISTHDRVGCHIGFSMDTR